MISNSFFCIWQLLVLFCGGLQALLGMIMFNLGLNFGFTSLGDQVHFVFVDYWIMLNLGIVTALCSIIE
jgi:hypothetical protein